MARKTMVQYIDDVDGELLDIDDLVIREFAVDGVVYKLELRTANAELFDSHLEKWVKAATRVGGRKNVRTKRTNKEPAAVEPRLVREWAHGQGFEVSDRGRIPGDILDAYVAAV